jgi:spermidine/putrescine transport system substrate-binding protein
MRSTRFGRAFSLVFVVALIAASCGDDDGTTDATESPVGNEGSAEPTAAPSGTLRLFSYSDGFDPEYMETFFEQYPDIELETSAFGSNDEAVAKILAGFEADVVNSCVDEATLEMVQRGMYQPLDVSRLEHWDDLWPGMKELPGVQVDGEVYIVPVDAGSAGIMYNADVITTPPTSWADLFDPQYAGRASLEDLSITAIDIGAFVNGISDPLAMSPDQLEMVKNYLIDNRDQFRTFWKGQNDIKAQFKSGEVVISSGYPGIAKSLRKEGVNVGFAFAEEGQMLWACGYGISPDAENVDAAYALLNWYTSLPPQIYAAENWNYITSNMGIIDEVSSDVVDDAGLLAFQEGDSSVNAIPASPPEDRQSWVAAWTEVKAS